MVTLCRIAAVALLLGLPAGAPAHALDAARGGAESTPLSLADAWAQALRQNLGFQSATLDLESARLTLLEAQGSGDPTLSFGVDTTSSTSASNDVTDGVATIRSQSSGWSIGVAQPLPTGGAATLSWSEATSGSNSTGQLLSTSTSDGAWLGLTQPLLAGVGPSAARAGQRSARVGLSAAELEHRAQAELLVLEVADAYWNLVAERERHLLSERALQIAQDELTDTRERQREGFAGSGDVLQVERAVGGARQALVLADASLEEAQTRLARAVGLDLTQPRKLEPSDRPLRPTTPPQLARSLELAQANNASWLLAGLAAEEARLADLEARWTNLPSLDVSAGVGRSGLGEDPRAARQQVVDGDYPAWGVGADLSVPLPARALIASRREASLDRERSRINTEEAAQSLRADVESAVRAVVRDNSRANLADQTLDAARRGLAADQELLRDGRGSTRDVVRSLEALQSSEVDALEAQINLQQSILQLLAVEGRLLTTFGLEGE